MFLNAYVPFLKRHLKYGKNLGCLRLDWDSKQNALVPNESFNRKLTEFGWLTLTGCSIIFQFVNLIAGKYDMGDKFIASLVLGMEILCFLVRLDFERDFKPMEILNRLISGTGNKHAFN